MPPLPGRAILALDELEPYHVEVGYGELGRRGWLGYEDAKVAVGGREYASALSTHPPARLRFAVPAGCARLRCQVALNDDVAGRGSHATFTVLADGRVAAEVRNVRAGTAPAPLVADLARASVLELLVSTTAWAYCHAVWLQPTLEMSGAPGPITDPLLRADITVSEGLPPTPQCIATVGSAGFEQWVDDLLGSVRAFGGCPDAHLVIFALDDAPGLHEVAKRHAATTIRCRPRMPLGPSSKSVLYSVASVIPAERFICLDADMLVLSRLDSLFAALDACPPGAILVCGEGNDHGIPDLASALDIAYGGGPNPPFFARESDLGRYPLVVNDGLLAGSRGAFCALDAELRRLPGVVRWIDERADNRWRNQFAVNVALARMAAAVELDPTWNVQLHVQDVEVDGTRASWRGRNVRVLHFTGNAKHRHKALRDAIRAEVRLAEKSEFEKATGLGRTQAASGPLSRPTSERLPGQEADGSPSDLEILRARPWLKMEVPDALALVPTMLWYRELQLLHWLARDYFTGAGRIVDGGSFLGGSTAALASGLTARADGPWDAAIASYDLFRVEEYTLAEFAAFLPDPTVGASFRSAFDANIAPWACHVEVREGDACSIGWSGEPIEVLFLDMVKTWQVNDLVLAEFLPCLMPGRSVIVQQDYLWGSCHWIHLTMELLDGSVERLDAMAKGSVAYLLTAPVPPDLIGSRLAESLEPDRQRQLMDRAVERWQDDERGLVELARAMMIAELDGKRSGLAELDAVLARHPGRTRVAQCAAIVRQYLR
jgi:NPCBM/NEW2 domain